jgi:DNA repair exonuclease SbcCD ATPase subunit
MMGVHKNKDKPEKIISLREGIERLVRQLQKEELEKLKRSFSLELKENREMIKDIENNIKVLEENIKDIFAFQESLKKLKITTLEKNLQKNGMKTLRELSESIDEIKESKKKIEELEDEIIKLKNEQDSFKKLESKINAINTEIRNMEKNFFMELDLMKRETNKLFKGIGTGKEGDYVNKLRNDLEDLKRDVQAIKQKISKEAPSSEIASLNEKIKEIEEEIKSVKLSVPVVIE